MFLPKTVLKEGKQALFSLLIYQKSQLSYEKSQLLQQIASGRRQHYNGKACKINR